MPSKSSSFFKTGAVFLFAKTVMLLLPLGWLILTGPHPIALMLIGGIVAFIEVSRNRLSKSLIRVWPIPLLALLYIATTWIAPPVEQGARPYDFLSLVCTLFYALPVGVCLAYWSRGSGQGPVLLGYALFCLVLALAAHDLVYALLDDQSNVWTNGEFIRANSDNATAYWNFFAVENVIIGIIPMTVFGLASTILVLVPGWNWHKPLMILAGATGLYANILVATRTTLLTVVLTLACLLPTVIYWHSKGRRRMRGTLLSCLAFAAIIVVTSLAITSTDQHFALLDRFSDLSEDSRKYVWIEAIGLLMRYPMGGGIARLKTEPWAHNLFLDFGLTNGFLGMIFMALAYALMVRIIWRAVRRAGLIDEPLGVVLLAGFVASFISSLTMPPQASFICFHYIVATFCLGLLRTKRQSTPDTSQLNQPNLSVALSIYTST